MGRSGCSALNLVVLAACTCLIVLANLGPAHSDDVTPERKEIFINVIQGPTFSFQADLNQDVWGLMSEINELEGIPYFYVTLDGKELNYNAKLSDNNIQAGTTVTLVIPEHRSLYTTNFTVRTRNGQDVPVATKLGNTVASLKEYIALKTGIPLAQIRVLLEGKELRNERQMALYKIHNGTTLLLGGSLEDCRQAVTIYVRTLGGAKLAVKASLADTASNLKEKIKKRWRVPIGVQYLFADTLTINGNDHLCDLGLEDGSIVHMFLFSSQITTEDQVAKLPELRPLDLRKAPIFHEADNVGQAGQSTSLYRDARNWIIHFDGRRPGWDPNRFVSAARLDPNPDDEHSIQEACENFRALSMLSNPSEWNRQETMLTGWQIKLSLALRPYRVAANLSSMANGGEQHPGITLGGGFDDMNSKRQVPLGADVNNWAPDAFNDSELMRLFGVSEQIRQILARSERTSMGILSIASQRRINKAILRSYLEAHAGYLPSVEYDEPESNEECGICRDELRAEPAIMLPCEHAYHADCIFSWSTNSNRLRNFFHCPLCKQHYLSPFKSLLEAELTTGKEEDK